jgi:DNA polymerase-3 subunit gamma/tau
MSTLYRKYRPQTFAEIAGQENIKQVLQNEIASGKVAHAFLFAGPRGIGKTSIARILAKALNCEARKEGEFEPCNKCEACLEISESHSLDVVEMDAATHTQVDKVRENIVENVRFAPSQRKYKIFIIDEVHMLSTSSFNALLKTLEEPPSHAVFILATTETHKIPETIISRCQKFDFKKIGLTELIERLKMLAEKEGAKIEEDVLCAIARNSEGGLRDAESALGQILSLVEKGKKITMAEAEMVLPRTDFSLVKEFADFLFKKDTSGALKFIHKISEEGVNSKRFLDETAEYLREVLNFKFLGADSISFKLLANKDEIKELQKTAETLPVAEIVRMIEVVLAKKQILEFSSIEELPLELAAVEICENLSAQIPEVKVAPVAAKQVFQAIPNYVYPKKEVKKAEVKPEENKPSAQGGSASGGEKSSFTLENIQKEWYNILNKAQEQNPSLLVILNVGVPMKAEGNVLKIGFQYPFYKDRLNKDKDRVLTENFLSEAFGVRMLVEGIVASAEELEKVKASFSGRQKAVPISAESLAEAFGGKVVE